MTYSNLTIYVSGGMSDQPNYNFDLFDEVSAYGRSCGFRVLSPAENDRNVWPGMVEAEGFDIGNIPEALRPPEHALTELFAWDVWAIGQADAIVLLPGWETSRGALVEIELAKLFGKHVWYAVRTGPTPGGGWYFQPCDPATPAAPVVVGLCGYAQAGKDTVANILVEHYGFERIAFADALREMLYALNPMLDGSYSGWNLRSVIDAHGWDRAKQEPAVRELLQRLGTEAGRNVLGQDIWVRTALAKAQPGGRYVISDVRFPNEAQAIEALGGELWRIDRPGRSAVNAHVSETALDDYVVSLAINNDGTLDDLSRQVYSLMTGAVARVI